MLQFLGANALWSLVAQADFLSKLVLLILLILSICSWTIIFYKFMIFRAKKNELQIAIEKLQAITTIDELIITTTFLKSTLAGDLFTDYLVHLRNLLKSHDNSKKFLTIREMELLQYTVDQIIEEAINEQSSYLSFLSITAAIGPLLGLFGTVWGLIHAFMDISAHGSADITTVAPGIAEALITTLAGIAVAVPALVMYHYFSGQLRILESIVRKLSDRFEFVVNSIVVQ